MLDTNVILHDAGCIYKFEDNNVYVPFMVLRELDTFKKGNEQINFNAREFMRSLDELMKHPTKERGVFSLGEGKGNLILMRAVWEPEPSVSPDDRIIFEMVQLKRDSSVEPIILVSKDINMRVKAYLAGFEAEDYFNDKVDSKGLFEDVHPTFEGIDGELIDSLYKQGAYVSKDAFPHPERLTPNLCFLMKSERNSVLARFDPFEECVRKVEKTTCRGITPRNREQCYAIDVLLDQDIKLVALTGKAGTGKTLLALAAALYHCDTPSLLDSEDESLLYDQILLSRPIVALSNKDMGFLPGDAKEKVMPYMQPLYDNLNTIKRSCGSGGQQIDKWLKEEFLCVEPLAFIRGRSLTKCFCIIDEAQNLTPHEIKTIVTRAGEGTKMVFTGDLQQIDSPYLDTESNGLAYMIDRMRGKKLFAHVNLSKGERSELAELASNVL